METFHVLIMVVASFFVTQLVQSGNLTMDPKKDQLNQLGQSSEIEVVCV